MSEMSFPKHWHIKTLGKFCRVFSGFAFKSSDYTKDGIPLIKIGNLQDGTVIISSDNDYVPDSWRRREELQRFTLKSGDILIALTGKTGKTAVVPPNLEDALLNQRVGKIELISSEVEHGFILAVTKTNFFQEAIQQNTFRSVQGNISPSSISQIAIPLPTLPEQRAIASVLGAIQDAKFARQKEIALERERKAALMDILFSHGTKGEPRKQTEIGEIPESWKVVELDKVCLKIVDCPHSTPKFVESGVLCARNVNIRAGIFVKQPASYTSENEYRERIKRLTPQEGDVLFSREAPIGEACVIPCGTKLSLGQRIMLLRVNPLILHAYFLVQSFYVTELRSRLLSQGRGVTAKHLNVGDVKRLEVPIPSLDEQRQISKILQSCDNKIAALEQEATRLDELFHAILEELMTGKQSTAPLIDAESQN